MDDKFAQAEKDATKRQTEGRRFWTGTIIAVIAAAAAVIAVVQNALN